MMERDEHRAEATVRVEVKRGTYSPRGRAGEVKGLLQRYLLIALAAVALVIGIWGIGCLLVAFAGSGLNLLPGK